MFFLPRLFVTLAKCALVLLALVVVLVPLPSAIIDGVYSSLVYPWMQRSLTPLSNSVPFAVGDVVLLFLIGAAVLPFLIGLRAARGGWGSAFVRATLNALAVAALGVLAFQLLWGFNYSRAPLVTRVDYSADRVTDESLRSFARVCVERVDGEYLTARAGEWPAEEQWRPELARSFSEIAGELGLYRFEPALPKTSLFDFYLVASGVSGLVNPFGHEVILESNRLPFETPFLLSHEWAHLAGFANEAEASFIGALACIRSEMPEIRYSGWLALYQHAPWPDRDKAEVRPVPSDGVVADLRAIRDRQKARMKAISELQDRVYDGFLRANRVGEGIESYGLLVNLMVGTRFDEWKPVLLER